MAQHPGCALFFLVVLTFTAQAAAGPQHIVSLSPTATELTFALGAGAQVVGVTRFDDAPPQVKALPKVGGFVDADLEALLALAPDLVLAATGHAQERSLGALRRLGVAVLTLPDATLDDMFKSIACLGQALQRPAAAAALAANLQAALQRGCGPIKTAGGHTPSQPKLRQKVLVIVGRRPLVVAGPQSFYAELLRLAGADNAFAARGPFARLDAEALGSLRPSLILDLAAGEDDSAEVFWQRFAALPAVRSARLVTLRDSLLLRMGPRLPQALQVICEVLNPPQASRAPTPALERSGGL
jgi:ABC-type hemin transport system substrate-binding protein